MKIERKRPTREHERARYRRGLQEYTHLAIRIGHDEMREIEAIAKRQGTSKTQKIREYITWGLCADEEIAP